MKDPSITDIGSPGTNYREDSNLKKNVTIDPDEVRFKNLKEQLESQEESVNDIKKLIEETEVIRKAGKEKRKKKANERVLKYSNQFSRSSAGQLRKS